MELARQFPSTREVRVKRSLGFTREAPRLLYVGYFILLIEVVTPGVTPPRFPVSLLISKRHRDSFRPEGSILRNLKSGL